MDEVKLDISGVMEKEGKRIAYVRFSRGEDYAEGYIPDCVFTKVSGFLSYGKSVQVRNRKNTVIIVL